MERYITGYTLYFRNNSTGNPTKIHIIKPNTEKTFCGFEHHFAEFYDLEEFSALRVDCCKHCLKAVDKIAP